MITHWQAMYQFNAYIIWLRSYKYNFIDKQQYYETSHEYFPKKDSTKMLLLPAGYVKQKLQQYLNMLTVL
ncbi:MAG: hypothetical protein ACRCV3_00555 [Desulfovibrionaceae bacterium]